MAGGAVAGLDRAVRELRRPRLRVAVGAERLLRLDQQAGVVRGVRRVAGRAAAALERLVHMSLAAKRIVTAGAQRRLGVGELEGRRSLLGMRRRRRLVTVVAALGGLVHGAPLDEGRVALRALAALLRRSAARERKKAAEEQRDGACEKVLPASGHAGIMVSTGPTFTTPEGLCVLAPVRPDPLGGRGRDRLLLSSPREGVPQHGIQERNSRTGCADGSDRGRRNHRDDGLQQRAATQRAERPAGGACERAGCAGRAATPGAPAGAAPAGDLPAGHPSVALPPGHPPAGGMGGGCLAGCLVECQGGMDASAIALPPVDPEGGLGAAGLVWTAPAGWVAEPPANPMRRAQYKVPGAAGDG